MPDDPHNPHDPPLGPPAIQAPWRLSYLERLGQAERRATASPTSPPTSPPASPPTSFLSEYWGAPEHDEKNHVIVRTARGMVLLNAYPYANGHLLVALGEARPTLLDYDTEQRAELWMLTELATDLMQRALEPHGINFGINQGRHAGAGIPQHLHAHLVPRWSGDTNFISVVGQVRVIPGALDAMAERYRDAWSEMDASGPATR